MTSATQAYTYAAPSSLVDRVSLADGSCTCEWWWDHRVSRGPCKHVLATRIVARAAVEISR
ncbi:SWIM zinc finger family protein [Acrocarpospora macrocephala]|uniref:SWIM zinc finger family protein n=1 Tax=Acrocarpospora macrocephala TaxID=150177 RepID=UPI001FE64130|nr:SWIM zinc finger family protein [Acrocarpospora macrocephala]